MHFTFQMNQEHNFIVCTLHVFAQLGETNMSTGHFGSRSTVLVSLPRTKTLWAFQFIGYVNMMCTLAPTNLNAVRAPCPVVEMGQLVVSKLRGCRLIWRCLPFLWKNFLVSGSCRPRFRAFSIPDVHFSIAPRQPKCRVTAFHRGISRKYRAYWLGKFNYRAGR